MMSSTMNYVTWNEKKEKYIVEWKGEVCNKMETYVDVLKNVNVIESPLERLQLSWKKLQDATSLDISSDGLFDLFLTQLIGIAQQDRNILDNFYNDNLNVIDVISRQFISDIRERCTLEDISDELGPLKEYLLKNAGWKYLLSLQYFVNVKVSFGDELTNLLMSLYSVVDDELPEHDTNCGFISHDVDYDIHDLVNIHNNNNSKPHIASRIINSSENSWTQLGINNVELHLSLIRTLKLFHQDLSENSILSLLKFSLENLCSLQFQNTGNEILKKEILILLIATINRVKTCENVLQTIIDNGIMSIFMELFKYVTNSINSSLELHFGILYAICKLNYEICFCEPVMLLEKLLRIFINNSSQKLIVKAVKKIPGKLEEITILMCGISYRLKIIRDDTHHHHETFGCAYDVSSFLKSSNLCIISCITIILVQLTLDIEQDREMILKSLIQGGTCCCVPLQAYVPKLLNLKENLRSVLEFIEKIIKETNLPCHFCTGESWNFLLNYNKLLTSFPESVGNHILNIFRYLQVPVKELLLSEVILPNFELGLEKYGKMREDEEEKDWLEIIKICILLLHEADLSGILNCIDLQTIDYLFDSEKLIESCLILFRDRILWKIRNMEISSFFITVFNENTTELKILNSKFEEILNEFLGNNSRNEYNEDYCTIVMKLNEFLKTIVYLLLKSDVMTSFFRKYKFNQILNIVLKLIEGLGDEEEEGMQGKEGEENDDDDEENWEIIKSNEFSKLWKNEENEKLKMEEFIFKNDKFMENMKITQNDVFSKNEKLLNESENFRNSGKMKYLQEINGEDENEEKNKLENIENEKNNINEENGKNEIKNEENRKYEESRKNEKNEKMTHLYLNMMESLLIICLTLDNDDKYIENNVKLKLNSALNSGRITVKQICDTLLYKEDDHSSVLYPTVCKVAVELINSLNDGYNDDILCYLKFLINKNNVKEIINEGITIKLINFIKETRNESSQILALKLIGALFSYNATKNEVKLYFELFFDNNINRENLLIPLTMICEEEGLRPDFYVKFPSEGITDFAQSDKPAEALAISLRELHRDIVSPWSVSAIVLPLNKDIGWNIWSNGFSLCFWFKIEKSLSSSSPRGNLEGHLISIAYDSLIIEFWIKEFNEISTKITRPDGNSFEILSEMDIKIPSIPIGCWTNIGINVKDTIINQKMAMEITIINNDHELVNHLHFNALLIKKIKPVNILIGEIRNKNINYLFGNLMIFASCILNREVMKEIINYGPNLENLLTEVKMKKIQEYLLATFTARNYKYFNVYQQMLTVFQNNSGFFKKKQETAKIPKEIQTLVFCNILPDTYKTITRSIIENGGIPYLMLFLAKMVKEEICPNLIEISLKLINLDSELQTQFVNYDGYNLIYKIVKSKLFKFNTKSMEILLNLSCDKYLIKDAKIITRILLPCWKIWDDVEIIRVLYKRLKKLCSSNAHAQTNLTMLRNVNLLDTILNICKERYLLQFNDSNLDYDCLLNFIKMLIGSPPSLNDLKSLISYLLVTYPTSLTYITLPDLYFSYSRIEYNSLPILNYDSDSVKSVRKYSSSIFSVKKTHLAYNDDDTATYVDRDDDDDDATAYNDADEYETVVSSNLNENIDDLTLTDGVLTLLQDIIKVLPDNIMNQLFKDINTHVFLILANHPDDNIRTSVVKVILSYFIRMNNDKLTYNFVIQLKGFYLLANQISNYNATDELVNCCVSLIAKCNWITLPQFMDKDDYQSLNLAALPPLLALLPKTVHNIELTRNILELLKSLIYKHQAVMKLVEHGLTESLITLVKIVVHSVDYNDNCSLLTDIMSILSTMITACIQTPGVQYLQILNEIIYKWRYLEITEEATCGIDMDCVHIIHDLHCDILKMSLENIQSVLATHHSQDIARKTSPSSYTFASESTSVSISSIPSLISFTSSIGKSKTLNRSELTDRYKLVINRATEYLQFSCSCYSRILTERDISFACHLFSTLIADVSHIVQNKPYISIVSPWSSVFWLARDTIRLQAANLLIWLLTPSRPVLLRTYPIEVLLNEPKAKEVLSSVLFINSETEQRFILFLWHLMYSKSSNLAESELEACEQLKNLLQEWQIISPQSIGHAHDIWQFEVMSTMRELSSVYWDAENAQKNSIYKCVRRWDVISKEITEASNEITNNVIIEQGLQRKELLNLIRTKYRLLMEAETKWKHIIKQMTHERAPWFSRESYPTSWELDPTEGPARVRKRLRRCWLNIDKRFFKREHQYKACDVSVRQPFSFLFDHHDNEYGKLSTDHYLPVDERISFMCVATYVQPFSEIDGELIIGKELLYFIAAQRCGVQDYNENTSISMNFADIKELHNRRYELQERAIEIFLVSGKTFLIAFPTFQEKGNFITALMECPLRNQKNTDLLLEDTIEIWREGRMTNWEYLKILNKVSGRTYNDLMQYPVMPFILADYTSETLNLSHSHNYRNLRKPMAVQDKKKELHFINHYNYLKGETENVLMGNSSSIRQPYHYASHYSNSGTVLHFLLRIPPYTQMFLKYQDNNFDLPDRTFHSLETTWKLISSESTTDVKELIPEFFYLPEFLQNTEGFNFGVRQNSELVDDVKLPKWCNGNARLFVLVHRQILESDYVRENLPGWIDLVFGYKQRGKPAVDSINVFHPATYYGFNLDSITDDIERTAWETMIRTYGQTPRQLFRSAHPAVIQYNLTSKVTTPIAAIPGVDGIKWGCYVGSPSQASPSIVWINKYPTPVAKLLPLRTNDVFGLPSSVCLLLSYDKEKSINMINGGISISGAGILSWITNDGLVYLKQRKEQPPVPVIYCRPSDPITTCCTTPDYLYTWIGLQSGCILVYSYKFSDDENGVEFGSEPIVLIGHQDKIKCIWLSRSFGIAVSGSDDGTAIIWDLDNISYIRTISGFTTSVEMVAVSDTLGDIATVAHNNKDNTSIVRLHTINAEQVGSINTTDRVTSICFSHAPEGKSVNVLATALQSGVISLWSTWNLMHVVDFKSSTVTLPIIAVMYSNDSQYLYATLNDGTVVIWGHSASGFKTENKTPKFLNLTAM